MLAWHDKVLTFTGFPGEMLGGILLQGVKQTPIGAVFTLTLSAIAIMYTIVEDTNDCGWSTGAAGDLVAAGWST
eukprot:gene26420-32378_t